MPVERTGESRTARHSRRDVVDAALRLLEANGLPDLTMRRLAAALDVQASALYWHFPNKQSLLAEVSDRIVGHGAAVSAPAADWCELTVSAAQHLRQSLLAYRDGAELVSSSVALGLGSGVPLARLTAAISGGGFEARTGEMAATTLLHFVLGHVWHEQQRLQYDSLGVSVPAGVSEDDAFTFGVTLLVEGLRSSAR